MEELRTESLFSISLLEKALLRFNQHEQLVGFETITLSKTNTIYIEAYITVLMLYRLLKERMV